MMRDKANKSKTNIEEDEKIFISESAELAEYENHFKAKMNAFEKELEEMKELQSYLGQTRDHINNTVSKKMASLESQNVMKQEKFAMTTKLEN
jgi:SMC interacting uncharacterized protein involved in chromosome segregation